MLMKIITDSIRLLENLASYSNAISTNSIIPKASLQYKMLLILLDKLKKNISIYRTDRISLKEHVKQMGRLVRTLMKSLR